MWVDKGSQLAPDVDKEVDGLSPVDLQGVDERHERYNRVIFVLEMQNEKVAKGVLDAVQRLNRRTCGLDGVHISAVGNYELTENEKKDPELNILSGFVLMDKKCRIMVVEGLRKRGIEYLIENVPRLDPNDEKNRVIYNTDVGYADRLWDEVLD